jgi:hypothetical protein
VAWIIVIGVLAAGFLAVALLSAQPGAKVAYSTHNPAPDGARALAQVLQRHGVEVTEVDRTAAAVARATEDTTLAIVGRTRLADDQVAALAETGADIVLIGDIGDLTGRLSQEKLSFELWSRETSAVPADCSDTDAQAAGEIDWRDGAVRAGVSGVDVCFADPLILDLGPEEERLGGYASVEANGRRVSVIADPAIVANEAVAHDGNAALALRALGRNPVLTWYIARYETDDGMMGGGINGLLPPAAPLIGAIGAVAFLAAAWSRGRRLGPPVSEPLPVEVPASELSRSLGRLYRAARATGHAAAALRAGTVARLCSGAGLGPTSSPDAIVHVIAARTGRDEVEVRHLLYGPPRMSEGELTRLATDLEHLEQEAHR